MPSTLHFWKQLIYRYFFFSFFSSLTQRLCCLTRRPTLKHHPAPPDQPGVGDDVHHAEEEAVQVSGGPLSGGAVRSHLLERDPLCQSQAARRRFLHGCDQEVSKRLKKGFELLSRSSGFSMVVVSSANANLFFLYHLPIIVSEWVLPQKPTFILSLPRQPP